MIKAVIIDDEQRARNTLSTYLREYCSDVLVLDEADSVASGVIKVNELNPDLIFLDIHMGDGTGFDLLEQLEKPNLMVIFVTAFDEYAIKAFSYSAVHYLLKPLNPLDLVQSVNVARKRSLEANKTVMTQLAQFRQEEAPSNLVINCLGEIHVVQIATILKIDGSGSYSTFTDLQGRTITSSKPIRVFEDLLPKEQFFRCHQSHIVNIKHIKMVNTKEGVIVLSDNSQIAVARTKKEQLLAAIKVLGLAR